MVRNKIFPIVMCQLKTSIPQRVGRREAQYIIITELANKINRSPDGFYYGLTRDSKTELPNNDFITI